MDLKRKKSTSPREDTSPSDDEQPRKRMRTDESSARPPHHSEVETSQSVEAQDSPLSTPSVCSPGPAGYYSFSPQSQVSSGTEDSQMEDSQTEDSQTEDSQTEDSQDGSTDSGDSLEGNNLSLSTLSDLLRLGGPKSIAEALCGVIPEEHIVSIIRKLIEPARPPTPRTKLSHVNSIEDVIHLLQTRKNIIVLTGAGVSVSCGIPDFRSPNGIYARLKKDFPDLPNTSAMFDIRYFSQNPHPFFKFAKEIYPGQYRPSPCHYFIKTLEDKGKLLRNYTQNIDTLEQETGISRVVQCHGSFATATCCCCGRQVEAEAIKDAIFNQVVPHCTVCPPENEDAIMKPDIVFFHENLPAIYHDNIDQDKDKCDLLIVIGSSLKVQPVNRIPFEIKKTVPQILINREPLMSHEFDVELLGDCDTITTELLRLLNWKSSRPNAPEPTPLTEVDRDHLPIEAHRCADLNTMYSYTHSSSPESDVEEESEERDLAFDECIRVYSDQESHDLSQDLGQDPSRDLNPDLSCEVPSGSQGSSQSCQKYEALPVMPDAILCNACSLPEEEKPSAPEPPRDCSEESRPVVQPFSSQEGAPVTVSSTDKYLFCPITNDDKAITGRGELLGHAALPSSHHGTNAPQTGCLYSTAGALTDSRSESNVRVPPLHQECYTDTEDECYQCKKRCSGKVKKQVQMDPEVASANPEVQSLSQPVESRPSRGLGTGQSGGHHATRAGSQWSDGRSGLPRDLGPGSSEPGAESLPFVDAVPGRIGSAPQPCSSSQDPSLGQDLPSSHDPTLNQDLSCSHDLQSSSAPFAASPGRKKPVPMSQFLPENTYVFIPPNRYIFKDALVYHLQSPYEDGLVPRSSEETNECSDSHSTSLESSSPSRSQRTPSSDSGLPQDADDGVNCPPPATPSLPLPQPVFTRQNNPAHGAVYPATATEQSSTDTSAENPLPPLEVPQPVLAPKSPLHLPGDYLYNVRDIPLPPGSPPPPGPYQERSRAPAAAPAPAVPSSGLSQSDLPFASPPPSASPLQGPLSIYTSVAVGSWTDGVVPHVPSSLTGQIGGLQSAFSPSVLTMSANFSPPGARIPLPGSLQGSLQVSGGHSTDAMDGFAPLAPGPVEGTPVTTMSFPSNVPTTTSTSAVGSDKAVPPPSFLPINLDSVVPLSDTDADTPTGLSKYLCDGGSSTPQSAEALVASLLPSQPPPASPDR